MATNQLRQVLQTLRGAALPHEEAGLTDGQLLERYLRSREEAALTALVCRHGPMVWGVCRRVLRSHHDAEDAFQATFLVLVRKAASLASRELVANWLYGVAQQTALKARATTAKRFAREKQMTAMPEPAVEPQEPGNDLHLLLDRELSRLPDKYRALIVLCDLEGKTRKEAARHFHLPEGTVASRLATARTMLTKRLVRQGVPVTGVALAAVLSPKGASASVPASVAANTIKAATLFAAGQATAPGVISVQAVALAEGVLKTMLLTKLKIAAAAVLVALVFLGVSTAALTQQVLADKPAFAVTQQPPADPPMKDKKATIDLPVKEKKAEEPRPTRVSGVLQAVDADKNTVTVEHREGVGTFALTKDAKIEIDGKVGRLAAVPVGANVNLTEFVDAKTAGSLQAAGRAFFGNLVKAVDAAKHTITIQDRDEEKTFPVAPDAFITVDGKNCKLAAVPTGAFVNMGLAADQQRVLSIGADGPYLGGCGGSLVKAIDVERRTITFDEKAPAEVAGKTFTLVEDANIVIDGRGGKLAELRVGCYVNVGLHVDQRTVGQVHAQGPSDLCDCGGSLVVAVDAEKRTITFDDKTKAKVAGKTYPVAKDANITIDGKSGKLADLPPGSYISVTLQVDQQTIGSINAQGPPAQCECGGSLVKAVDAEKYTITMDEKAKTEVAGRTFPVAKDANITIDGKSGKLADLPAGSYVNLNFNVDQKTVGTIFAQGPPVPGIGVVKAVDAEKNTITVEDKTYPVAKNANIQVDGNTVKLAGVPTGIYVSLRLCVDQQTVGTIFHTKAP